VPDLGSMSNTPTNFATSPQPHPDGHSWFLWDISGQRPR